MKRRILAFLCVLSTLMGMIVMPATAATSEKSTAPTTYDVGYAKVDISPLTDLNDDSTIIAVPMSGYSNSRERLATSIDEHIYSTCTAITDADGNTVLYYTLDCISPPANLVSDVKAAVVAALSSEGVKADRIYINGSHSHEAPDFSTVELAKVYYDDKDTNQSYANLTTTFMADVTKGLGLTESITEEAYVELITQWSNYYNNTVITGMTQAAEDALEDRRACTMTKGQIDAGDYTSTQLASSSPFYNKPMNAVRHYKQTVTVTTTKQIDDGWLWSSWEDVAGTTTTETNTYYNGDNFGQVKTAGTTYSEEFSESGEDYRYKYVTTVSAQENVNEADDNIYLIQFKPADGSAPIVFANWRGHPSINGGSVVTEVSSDYIDHFRNDLESAGYRPAFFLGASGNINAHNKLDDWYTNVTASDEFEQKNLRTAAYGEMLGEITQYGLLNNMSGDLSCGTIRTLQSHYQNTHNTPSKGLYEVAVKALAANSYPYTATGSDGVSYTVDTYYNANNIKSKYTSNKTVFNQDVNVIKLGDSVAFVTSPNELFDYYNADKSTAADDNKWFELNDDETYGTPFIMGYTNGHNSYLPNALAFDYTTATGSTGSYESHSSNYAKGGGEELIDQYKTMLGLLAEGDVQYKCQHCQEVVTWTPLFEGAANVNLDSGHYVLLEDLVGTNQSGQQIVGASDGSVTESICLDLNGWTYSSDSRCAIVYKGSTLNIMNMPGVDADGNAVSGKKGGTTGKMIGMTNSNNPGGGAFSVSAGATVNLYGGTLAFEKRDPSAFNGTYGNGLGGVFYLSGTLNMFGGTIEGAEMQNEYPYKDNYIGAGGAIYLAATGVLNMSGGEITSGSVPDGGAGPCIYMAFNTSNTNTGTVKLSGDASIGDIYYPYYDADALQLSGTYTGTAALTFADSITLQQNLDIGDVASGTDISGAALTCTNDNKYQVRISGTDLILKGYAENTAAVVINGTTETECTSLANAISAYTSNGSNYIKLIRDVSAGETVTLSKTVYLDLNGYSVAAAVDATAAPLYVMDSMTDDYNVKDSYGYGKLTGTLTGTVEGVPVESDAAVDGYLKVTETAGVSFHRVNLQINTVVLRPHWDEQDAEGVYNPDVYYKITEGFSADSVVADLVDSFGIAMLADDGDSSNGKEIPSADTLTDLNHSSYTGFTAGKGKNAANGTMLTDILKETNNILINRRNANTTVYGSAYIKMGDAYMFGGAIGLTLKYVVETAASDTIWNTLSTDEKEGIVKLYETYTSIFSTWDLTNVTDYMDSAERSALKILVVGNSHGLDATNLLYEVFEDQKQNGKYITADGREYNEVVIGNLYHSGANMYQHSTWIDGDIEYSYDKIGTGDSTGVKWQYTVNDNCMDDALADEEWDIVVMQQMNHRSGIIGGNYTSVDSTNFNQAHYLAVAKHIKEMCPDAKLAWHMVWTNPDEAEFFDDTSSTFVHPSAQNGSNMDWITNHNDWYGTDGRYVQSNLYDGIVEALETKILNKSWMGYDIDYVLPSAVAVEYAQDILGCSDAVLYRDYTHINNYGRLMVAYTWWATLMGYESIGTDIISEIPGALNHGQPNKNENLSKNTAGNYVVTGDLKNIITRSVNYALSVNDPTLTNENAYRIVEDDSIAILGIGNSYTMDCMWMLGQIYAAENPGKDVKLGIAYISGGTLQSQAERYNNDTALDYFCYLDSATGTWQYIKDVTLAEAIQYNGINWDLVSLQQGSTKSVDASTYDSNIQFLQGEVADLLGYTPEFFWNQTWAWPVKPLGTQLETVEAQTRMYNQVVSAVQQKIVPDHTFSRIMPAGVAIQNANSVLEDADLYCDNVHLGAYGRIIAGYVLYCQLENISSDALTELKVTSTPAAYSKIHSNETKADVEHTTEQMNIALEAVRNALITGRDCTFASTDLTDLISG